MTTTPVGQAQSVEREVAGRKLPCWDLTPWDGGYLVRRSSAPGAAVIKDDLLVDLQTGAVYRDSRFTEEPST